MTPEQLRELEQAVERATGEHAAVVEALSTKRQQLKQWLQRREELELCITKLQLDIQVCRYHHDHVLMINDHLGRFDLIVLMLNERLYRLKKLNSSRYCNNFLASRSVPKPVILLTTNVCSMSLSLSLSLSLSVEPVLQ